jgi:hypothetical protein
MTLTDSSIPTVDLVTLLLPSVGRVLALRTAQRSQCTEYLLSDLGGQNIYLTDISQDGIPPAAYAVQEIGTLASWMGRPEIAPAVAALLAHEADCLSIQGPLSFARAVQHVVDQHCSAAQAIEHATALARACAKSEAHTEEEVRRLMGAPA